MLFNKKKKQAGANTVNLAGGEAFTETTQLELVALMLTSMLQNQYYRSANVTAQRLKELIAKVADKKFVAMVAGKPSPAVWTWTRRIMGGGL